MVKTPGFSAGCFGFQPLSGTSVPHAAELSQKQVSKKRTLMWLYLAQSRLKAKKLEMKAHFMMIKSQSLRKTV